MTLDLKKGKTVLTVLVILFSFMFLNLERVSGATENIYSDSNTGSGVTVTNSVNAEGDRDGVFASADSGWAFDDYWEFTMGNSNILDSEIRDATSITVSLCHYASANLGGLEGMEFDIWDDSASTWVVLESWTWMAQPPTAAPGTYNENYSIKDYITSKSELDAVRFRIYAASYAGIWYVDGVRIVIDYTPAPDDVTKYPDRGKFDFECVQTSYDQIRCYIISTRGIPIERLQINWDIEGKEYEGNPITHNFNPHFQYPDTVRVNCTFSIASGESKTISKVIQSSYTPFWLWILLLAIGIFLLVTYLYGKKIKRMWVTTKRKVKKKSKAWVRKVKSVGKAIGWTSVLLLGIAFVWLPTASPDDLFTTVPLIMILGFNIWLIIGIIIIIACVFVLGKKIKRRIKYGRWV